MHKYHFGWSRNVGLNALHDRQGLRIKLIFITQTN